MDCMHFTLSGITTHAQAMEKAEAAARGFFEHLRYDIETEAKQPNDLIDWHGRRPPLGAWDVEVTVRVWDLEE